MTTVTIPELSRIETPPPCQICEQAPAIRTISVQTIPGSLDTKFVELAVCRECAVEYQRTLARVWQGAL